MSQTSFYGSQDKNRLMTRRLFYFSSRCVFMCMKKFMRISNPLIYSINKALAYNNLAFWANFEIDFTKNV